MLLGLQFLERLQLDLMLTRVMVSLPMTDVMSHKYMSPHVDDEIARARSFQIQIEHSHCGVRVKAHGEDYMCPGEAPRLPLAM